MILSFLRYAAILVFMVAVFDAIAFVLWMVSGQVPPDGIYAGSLTAHALLWALG